MDYNKLKIKFWKIVAIILDSRPRIKPQNYDHWPIAYTDISSSYDPPMNFKKKLYEWDEGDKHWMIYTRY